MAAAANGGGRVIFLLLVPVRASPVPKRKKENGQAKGAMGGRHAATTQGFYKERSVVLAVAHPNPWPSASFYLPSQSLAESRA